jgi:hypothetical protein
MTPFSVSAAIDAASRPSRSPRMLALCCPKVGAADRYHVSTLRYLKGIAGT